MAKSSLESSEFGWVPDFLSLRKRWVRVVLAVLVMPAIVLGALGLYLWGRFGTDTPVEHVDIAEHFKYGSTGGERESGFPYWIFQALPRVCAEHLPGEGYASLGMIFEPGHDLPVGMSKRRYTGIDRTFLNCAVCHTSTVRDSPEAKPRLYLGMPAQTLDLKAFESFFFACAKDPKFSSEYVVPEVREMLQARGEDLDPLDRLLVYPVAIALMRERLLMLEGRFKWALHQPDWGPGRVDTFNSSKVLFNFPPDRLTPEESMGTADFPSIWMQQARKKRDDGEPMQLHWDGNNTKAEERNKNAAFGTGTTPPTIDLKAIARIEAWLLGLEPPPYPYAIDKALAAKGAPVYQEYCAECHGANGRDFKGEFVGHVTPIERIGTDRGRLDSFTYDLAANLGSVYAGYPWRFQGFRKTSGYANMPLDGVWLRGPYLHNGSVPTLRDLLEPGAARPSKFYRGNDVYDPVKVGFVTSVAAEGDRKYFLYDTAVRGNSNAGHSGKTYGTELSGAEKDALLEYLKTF